MLFSPAGAASFFGLDGYAQKYGVVFSAYGLGAIAGGIISGAAKDTFGSYLAAFWATLILVIISIIVAFILLKPPKK